MCGEAVESGQTRKVKGNWQTQSRWSCTAGQERSGLFASAANVWNAIWWWRTFGVYWAHTQIGQLNWK